MKTKRYAALTLLWGLLLLCTACQSAAVPQTAAVPTAAPQTTAQPTTVAATTEPLTVAPTEPLTVAPTEPPTQEVVEAMDVWEVSLPQRGEPIVPQPGQTTATWSPTLAEQFPADADCTDAQLLEKWMAVEGLTFADLDARKCTQLILTVASKEDGVSTLTTCYEKTKEGEWRAVDGFVRMNGWVGEKGISHDRKRNTLTSPAGLWALGTAFGNEKKPEYLHMPWRDVTPNSDWVCDENSIYFNTWQEREDETLTETWDYKEVEHLENYTDAYAYACVICYNFPPYLIPDRGCAIFLHCSEDGTGGCVGLLREDMLRTLLWLDPGRSPYILITGHQNA